MQRQCYVWLTSLAAALLLTVSGSAQASVSGKIVGTVIDAQTSEPLPGVNVVVEGIRMGAVTDVNGRYFILNVPAGTHSVRANLIGYGSVVAQQVRIRVDLTTAQDFRLDQEAIEIGQVTVTARRPLVQEDVTTSRTLISREELTMKPIDNVEQAVAQTAGAVVTNQGTFIRGGRANTGEVIYFVDGIALNDETGGGALATTLPRFAIEGMEVMRGSYTAEYGNASSAIITVVTPEGGQMHSGMVYAKSSDEYLGLDDTQADLQKAWDDDLAAWRAFLDPARDYRAELQRAEAAGEAPDAAVLDPLAAAITAAGGEINEDGTPISFVVDGDSLTSPLINQPGEFDTQKNNYREIEGNIGGPNPFAASLFPLNIFNTGNYFVSGRYFERDGRYRGQHGQDWALRGKLTFRNAAGDKKLSITLHRQEGEYEGSGYFISGDDGTTTEDWNAVVTTGDSMWVGSDGRLSWVSPADDPDAEAAVIDSLEGPNGQKVVATNYDMRPNWAGYSDDYSNEFSMVYTHTITPKTFYTIKLSRFSHGDTFGDIDPYQLYTANEMLGLTLATQIQDRFWRNTIPSLGSRHYQISPNAVGGDYIRRDQVAYTGRFDIESQFSDVHSGKRGFELKYYDLHRQRSSPVSGGQVYHDDFDVTPYQLSTYFAEKYETQGMILNIGARIDFLATNGYVPGDLDQPVNLALQQDANDLGQYSGLPGWIRDPQDSDNQWYWSPRIGVSYPISATSKMRFSYGHFYQFPELYRFFRNMERNMDAGWKYAGNPNLGPEKTILYEVGYEQQFARMMYASLTGFYKDIDGLIDMEERGTSVSTRYKYYMYVNSGYGNVRGFELTLQNQRYYGFQGNAAYTFMIARGRGGNTRQGFLIAFNNQTLRTEDYPLEWDQRHTLQLTLDYRTPLALGAALGGWGANAQYAYNSGIPYSTSERGITPPINDARYPSSWDIDLIVSKEFELVNRTKLMLFMEVLNVTDRRNVIQIQDPERVEISKREIERNEDIDDDGYIADTRIADVAAGETPEPLYGGRFRDPTSYSAGRHVRFGMQFNF